MGKWRYGVILDAGSSGTRVHVYRWLDSVEARQVAANDTELHRLPSLETHRKWTKKIHPGVSSFAEDPSSIGPDHLQSLLDHALEFVPQHSVGDTPLFVLATAGVRLLPKPKRTELLRRICAYAQTHTRFLLSDCDQHVQVISGETEGLYGWTASNYLLGGFDAPEEHDHGKGHHTYGFLELGGASAQIAFAPNATEAEKHAEDLKLIRLRTLDGQNVEYKVFVTTWLGFGVNAARNTYVSTLREASAGYGVNELPDPCLPAGLKTTLDGSLLSGPSQPPSLEPHLLGTGNFKDCLQATYPLLDKDALCEDQPCLFHGIHTPAIDFDVNHFIGTSEYWHTTHDVFEMGHKDESYDLTTYQQRVSTFCSHDWARIQSGVASKEWGKKVDQQTAYGVCFKASWLINILHTGIGVPREGLERTHHHGSNGTNNMIEQDKQKGFLEPFQAVNKIKNTELSWTLGKMVFYATSQVPPVNQDSLPVGFGSNVPGIPYDFQSPGGGITPLNSSMAETGGAPISQETYRYLYDTHVHRIPGLLLLALIFVVVSFCLCGRGRKSRLYRSLCGGSGKKRRLFSTHHDPAYERVLEDGGAIDDAMSFELVDAESDDSDQQQDSRRPGLGTSSKKAETDATNQDMMDRSGLVVRTESRVQLALNSGPRSRTGSPSRVQGSRHLTALAEQ